MKILQEVLAAIGGGVVVIIGLLTFGKSIATKFIDTLIEASAEKSIKKLENRFARSLSAYEILLKKELDYYESIDSIYAELIVRVQDCCDEIVEEKPDYSKRCEAAREELTYLLQNIPVLKNCALQYQAYIPDDIFQINSSVIGVLQEKAKILHPELKKLFDRMESDIDIAAIKDAEHEMLISLAAAEFSISRRLRALAECN